MGVWLRDGVHGDTRLLRPGGRHWIRGGVTGLRECLGVAIGHKGAHGDPLAQVILLWCAAGPRGSVVEVVLECGRER